MRICVARNTFIKKYKERINYIVDAFAEEVFKGNPAAVYVLEKWLPEAVMQNIAIENNLSETAFTVKEGQSYALRWFTPEREIDLCGHATLATAFVLRKKHSILLVKVDRSQ